MYDSQKGMEFYNFATSLKQFSADQTHVSLTLAKQVISSVARQKNLVFSPISIHVVLGLIATGSTGCAKQEVLEYLKSESSDKFNSFMSKVVPVLFADASSLGGPRLSWANGVWVDKRFELKEKFKEIVDNAYKGVTEKVDFMNQAETERKKLNLWAVKKTNGVIKQVLPPGSINHLTRLVFGNAVYFKGSWVEPFTKSRTKDFDFYLLDGNTLKVPFMTNSRKQRVSAFDGFKVLGLDYGEGEDVRKFSMYIFLPDAKDGLFSLVEKITAKPGFLERHLPHKFVKVGDFRIPKFKICFDFDATEILNKLGLESALSGGLTEMVNEELKVSAIVHKSFIEVNEEGTEAAAVTFGMLAGGSRYICL